MKPTPSSGRQYLQASALALGHYTPILLLVLAMPMMACPFFPVSWLPVSQLIVSCTGPVLIGIVSLDIGWHLEQTCSRCPPWAVAGQANRAWYRRRYLRLFHRYTGPAGLVVLVSLVTGWVFTLVFDQQGLWVVRITAFMLLVSTSLFYATMVHSRLEDQCPCHADRHREHTPVLARAARTEPRQPDRLAS
jgi:hypothetical protein